MNCLGLKMKLVLAACLLLSLVSVSHQFINGLGHLKFGIVGGAKLGIFKSGSRVAQEWLP